jgi:hypothetical protein
MLYAARTELIILSPVPPWAILAMENFSFRFGRQLLLSYLFHAILIEFLTNIINEAHFGIVCL